MLKTGRVGQWPMIPQNAFLYFPEGREIKENSNQKLWRKIFEDGNSYEDFQNQNLQKLQRKLNELRIDPHPWFDKANKLRFLQANKFKIQDTCKSIKEGSAWRANYFPLKPNQQAMNKLNEGALYFCGRDQQYRPILIVQIVKMKKYSEQIVPAILNNLLQYAIQNLLIEGQVENYVLIINLDGTGFSDRSSVSKIVSFTSNTYRSRLYASYLLNTPMLISKGWDAFASAIVSENTLRKIKISRNEQHEDMWNHIDKQIVQQKYGGSLPNQTKPFWPPKQKLMNYVCPAPKNKLVSKSEYNKFYKEGRLSHRKVKESLIEHEEVKPIVANPNQIQKPAQEQQISPNFKENGESILGNQGKGSSIMQMLPKSRIRQQVMVPIQKRSFRLFFEDQKFINIFKKK